jgi:hypothetical protein
MSPTSPIEPQSEDAPVDPAAGRAAVLRALVQGAAAATFAAAQYSRTGGRVHALDFFDLAGGCARLSTAALAALKTNQIVALNTAQLASLSSSATMALTVTQIAYATFKKMPLIWVLKI